MTVHTRTPYTLLSGVFQRARHIVRLLRRWEQRSRHRSELLELGPHLLFDIGLTRSQVEQESRRFPWQRSLLPIRSSHQEKAMIKINDDAPNFKAETTHGPIDFHQWMGDGWAVLFSHPKDFTPVCTTELGSMAKLKVQFEQRGVRIMGLSVDPVSAHLRWVKDIEETQGAKVDFPLIGDTELKVAKLYGMLPEEAGTTAEGRTAADNATVRSTFVIGPDKKIKLMFTYPMSTGRNFGELLRVIDSLQLTARHKLATPANWHPGDDVIIVPAVSDEDARKHFPNGWTAPKPYMRIVPYPAA